MKRILAAVLTLFIVSSSNANAFETGQELFLAAVPTGHEFRAYVSGIMEGHMLTAAMSKVPQAACPAPETTRQELADKVFSGLSSLIEQKPEILEMPARTLVLTILISAYPCRK